MKTVEQKAKAYDEALKIAKNYYSTTDSVADTELIELIFPELKESEDERIRKELIKIVNGHYSLFKEIDRAKTIAWLEKQNSNVDNANKEYWRGYREGKQEILDKYAELEKQGEQETLCSKCKKEQPSHSCQDITALGRCAVEHEQKPTEWNEEDEKMITNICKNLYDYPRVNSPFDNDSFKEAQKQVDWFKSRMHPKQEWSEDDENKINTIIQIYHPSKKIMDWLKSLKDRIQPQNCWKPSEEQIGVIEAIINNRPFQRRHLDSLYEQLKKLKGK